MVQELICSVGVLVARNQMQVENCTLEVIYEIEKKKGWSPAFARPYSLKTYAGKHIESHAQEGMALLDYFAAHAPEAPSWWAKWDEMKDDGERIEAMVTWRWFWAERLVMRRPEKYY